MKTKTMSRRAFLRGGAKIAIALPALAAMGPARVLAQNAAPKRLIVFYTPNGLVMDRWRPTGSESDWSLSPILQPLAAHKEDLIVMDGIDMESSFSGPGAAHPAGAAHLLTGVEAQEGDLFDAGGNTGVMGWGGGISIDQHIANHYDGVTRFKSLEFGVRRTVAQIRTRISYAGPAQPVPAESDPYAMFDRLFGLDGGPEFDLIRSRRQSIIDFVLEDYHALRPRLGAGDRQKVDAHLDAIRLIEQSLVPTGDGPLCRGPEMGAPLNIQAEENVPLMGRLQMDLLVKALQCDLTRVALFQWIAAVKGQVYSWLGQDEDHHALTHRPLSDTVAQDKLTQINAWYAEQLAYLISALKAVPEGEGTLFDNTVIWWCSEISHGNVHERRDMPFLLAGSCQGAFRTGRYLSYGAVPHNNLHVSLMNAMGVGGNSFGNPNFCTGPLSGLT